MDMDERPCNAEWRSSWVKRRMLPEPGGDFYVKIQGICEGNRKLEVELDDVDC